MIELQFPILCTQLITFAIAFGILWKFGWKPIVNLIDQRRNSIEKSLSETDEAKSSVKKLEEEYRYRVSQLQEQAQQMILVARAEAAHVRTSLINEAKKEIEHIKKKNDEYVQQQKIQMMQTVRSEIISFSYTIAEYILKSNCTQKIHDAKFEELLLFLDKQSTKEPYNESN